MKIIDLFSGIGGFALGFQRAGFQFTEHYFSEIDKHAIANYKYNFPNAKHIGDLLESVLDLKETKVALSSTQLPSLLTFDQVFLSGKMLRELTPQMLARIFGQLSKRLPTLMVTDLNNNCLIQNGFFPKIASGYTLSDILQEEVSQEYFLSQKMISFLNRERKVNHKPQLVEHSKPTAI